ncbi:hypothetical protein [Promicromonospora sp. NPDC060271]|uniref:hypothetical protein n=1 Tax=Promicromonospora sp. NPDC060271 TaxID=3347089 RepID=UPI003666D636
MNQLRNTTWGIAGRRLVIVLAAAVLATAGCAATGSDGGGERQAGPVAEQTADAGERAPEGEPGESEEREPAAPGGVFCVKLEESGDAFSMESLDGDPAEIDELVNTMRDLAAVAPGEIKTPMGTAVDFYEKVADAYVTKDEDAIVEIQGEAETMVQAAEEVGDWVATNCPDLDIDLAAGAGSGE